MGFRVWGFGFRLFRVKDYPSTEGLILNQGGEVAGAHLIHESVQEGTQLTRIGKEDDFYSRTLPRRKSRGCLKGQKGVQRERFLLTTYWSGSTDVFGGPSSRHGSLNFLFQVALHLPSNGA